jgi:hypothetical protein
MRTIGVPRKTLAIQWNRSQHALKKLAPRIRLGHEARLQDGAMHQRHEPLGADGRPHEASPAADLVWSLVDMIRCTGIAVATALALASGAALAQTAPAADAPAQPAPAASPAPAATPAPAPAASSDKAGEAKPAGDAAAPKKKRTKTTRKEVEDSLRSGKVPSRYRSRVPKEYQRYIPFDR